VSFPAQWSLARARWLTAILPVALLAAAIFILHRELSAQQLDKALQAAKGLSVATLVMAVALTVVNYLLLSAYDFLGLRYIGKHIGRGRTVLTAFIAYAFSHSLSFGALTGAAIRYRFYASDGLAASDVAVLTVFNSMTLATGFLLGAGLSLTFAPIQMAAVLHIHEMWVSTLGAVMVASVAGYVTIAARDGVQRIWRWSVRTPGPRLALEQPALGLLDLMLAGAVLWSLLPAQHGIGFATFTGVYAIAVMAGILSHVPGGIGVFESVVLLLLPQIPAHSLAGALIAYRIIYYVAPLTIAGLLFGAREFTGQRARLIVMKRAAELVARSIVPLVATLVVALAAVVLLLSGATPGIDSRLATLSQVVPLAVLELSHLAGSAIGVTLLILARALYRRVRAAYHITFWLLLGGIAASLLKGGDFEEAILLAAVLGFLYLGRDAFYRSSSLLYERFTPVWIATVAAVLILVTVVGFVTHRQAAYSSDLWWTFALEGDASRMLRASLVAAIVGSAILLANLLGPPHSVVIANSDFNIERVRGALGQADASLAQAVLAGDKRLLMSDSGRSLIMYQIARRSWVALGGPVGARAEHEALVWKFRELSDRHGGSAAFYQVGPQRLALYVDLGMATLKLGEEGRVALEDFSLDGSARAELRQAHRRVARVGATFEVVSPEKSNVLLPELRAISDAWLADKATAEKRFSVGSFTAAYVSQFPIALVRHAGKPVAFANLWTTPGREELSVDLMRFGADAPHGTMDFLFTELMLWGRAERYGWFNLGMAPLSGLATHSLAPTWHQLGNFIYRHGEHFYNFEGLRRYKAKFHPQWEPRYLVAPDGFALPRIFTDIAVLIAGGLKQLVSK